MAPFTTYIIPESPDKETAGMDQWLWIITDSPLLPACEELLQKICEALKAEFSKEVKLIVCPPEKSLIISDMQPNSFSLILSFGIPPSRLGIWIDLNGPGIRYLESYCFMLTIGLSELIHQPSAKKDLWSFMQLYLRSTDFNVLNKQP
ncbi:MAG: hypothetical protein ABIQ02_04225 [Saprospiraceae bacterium]